MFTHNGHGNHVAGILDAVAQLLPHGKHSVADLGCGAFRWQMDGYTITHVDRDAYPDAVYADLNDPFPFPDGTFDGVVAIELIEHLENPYHFLREVTRIATAWAIITTPTDERWFSVGNYHIRGHRIMVPLWLFQCYSHELGWHVSHVGYNHPSHEILIVKLEPLARRVADTHLQQE